MAKNSNSGSGESLRQPIGHLLTRSHLDKREHLVTHEVTQPVHVRVNVLGAQSGSEAWMHAALSSKSTVAFA